VAVVLTDPFLIRSAWRNSIVNCSCHTLSKITHRLSWFIEDHLYVLQFIIRSKACFGIFKRLSIKDILSRGVQVLQMLRTSTFFDTKNVGFFEIHSVSAWTMRGGGVERTRGEGVNFSRFCADIFYEWPKQILTAWSSG